jgi:hypothetical protein
MTDEMLVASPEQVSGGWAAGLRRAVAHPAAVLART